MCVNYNINFIFKSYQHLKFFYWHGFFKQFSLYDEFILTFLQVASPAATDVAEENKLLKRKIVLLMTSTNNPDIIKTVELQEENEKLKRELLKLRILNDALCDKMNKDEQWKGVEHTCMTRYPR